MRKDNEHMVSIAMPQILELSNKNFKAVIIKMLQ